MAFDIDDALEFVGLYRSNKVTGFASFLVGAGIGAAVGAGVAMLLTPYSGSESRERLARAGEDLKHQMSDKIQQIQGQVGTLQHNIQNRIQGTTDRDANTLGNGVSPSSGA